MIKERVTLDVAQESPKWWYCGASTSGPDGLCDLLVGSWGRTQKNAIRNALRKLTRFYNENRASAK